MGTINYLQAIKPDTACLKKIINSSLLFDWAIRIEYQVVKSGHASWKLWDNTFFALHTASPVIESLMKCYINNSRCIIRLNAERYRPQSQLLHTVYNPSFIPTETERKPEGTQDWLPLEQDVSPRQSGLIG